MLTTSAAVLLCHHISATKQSGVQYTAVYIRRKLGQQLFLFCRLQSTLPEQKKKFQARSSTNIIPHHQLWTKSLEILSVLLAREGQRVNLSLVLKCPAVVVGTELVKEPAALELERGHAEVSGPQGGQHSNEEKVKWGGGCGNSGSCL